MMKGATIETTLLVSHHLTKSVKTQPRLVPSNMYGRHQPPAAVEQLKCG